MDKKELIDQMIKIFSKPSSDPRKKYRDEENVRNKQLVRSLKKELK